MKRKSEIKGWKRSEVRLVHTGLFLIPKAYFELLNAPLKFANAIYLYALVFQTEVSWFGLRAKEGSENRERTVWPDFGERNGKIDVLVLQHLMCKTAGILVTALYRVISINSFNSSLLYLSSFFSFIFLFFCFLSLFLLFLSPLFYLVTPICLFLSLLLFGGAFLCPSLLFPDPRFSVSDRLLSSVPGTLSISPTNGL